MKDKHLLFLSANDIKRTLSMRQTIDLMKEAFRQISQGKVNIPLRTHLDIAKYDGGALFMPAHSNESNYISLKLVTVFQNNFKINLPLIHALVFLLDGINGQPLAIMDGEYLTALRTAAGSGLATDILARKDAQTLGIIGAGIQGHAQVSAICEVRDIRRILIYDNNPEAARLLSESIDRNLVTESNPPAIQISECDIICTATTSSTPVFDDAHIGEGTHINAIGAYQPEKREIPGETIKRSKVFVDQRAVCLKEAGDLIIPINEKLIDENHICGELGEILSSAKPGRSNMSQITIFKSVGNAAQDLITASSVYEKAKEQKIGTMISL